MKTGKILVKHLYIAQNNGITAGPQLVANQMSGAAIQGLSRVMWEQPTWSTERVTSLDWVSYPILRFADAPKVTLVNVHPGEYVTVNPDLGRRAGDQRDQGTRTPSTKAGCSPGPVSRRRLRSDRRSPTRCSTRPVPAFASRP